MAADVAGIRRGHYGPAAASAHRKRSLPRGKPHERGDKCSPPGEKSAAAANRRNL